MENFARDIETIRKKQMQMLSLITEIKNGFDELTNRLRVAKEEIS